MDRGRHISILAVIYFFLLLPSGQFLSDFCFPGSEERICFNVVKENRSFFSAAEECQRQHKVLLTVENKTQQKFVLRILNKTVGPDVQLWFGFHSTLDRYRWASGAPVVDTFLAPNVSEPHSCFAIHAGDTPYTWTPKHCSSKLWFLCASNPRPNQPPTPDVSDSRGCPQTFTRIGSRCLYPQLARSEARSWTQASQFCANLTARGTLATISSFLEQDYISVSMSPSFNAIWIGMQRFLGEHRWSTGEKVSFTNWIPGAPASGESPLCTMMHQRPKNFGEWEDVDCHTRLGFFCQAPLLPSGGDLTNGISTILLRTGKCRSGFFEFHGRCYRLVLTPSSQTAVPSETLRNEGCTKRSAPHSPDELALMRLLLNAEVKPIHNLAWIGVSFNRSSDGMVKFDVEDGLPFPLTPEIDFSQFLSSGTNQSVLGTRNCLALDRLGPKLVHIACGTQLPSICGYTLSNYPLSTTNTTTTCPLNWQAFGTKCYLQVPHPPLTWLGAEQACQALYNGSHLISVHSPAEQVFLSNLTSHQHTWLGLRVQLRTPTEPQPHYQWSDHTAVDYLSFAVGQPSTELNNGEPEECVMLQSGSHDWNDVSCYDRFPYVCQISLSGRAENTPVASLPVISPETCTAPELEPNLCVQLFSKPATFWSAVAECESHDRTLVTIPSLKHQQFLMGLLRKLFVGSSIKVYIGLFASEGRWSWISGYPSLPSTFWSSGHPTGSNTCVYIDSEADGVLTWKTGSCDQPLPYLCAKHWNHSKPLLRDFAVYTCPENYTRVESGCFLVKAGLNDQATWDEANELCSKTAPNATLASVNSLHEQDGLSALLALESSSAWIGLRLMNGVHSWQRGDPVIYTNWDKDEPVMQGQRCTSMGRHYNNMGDWADIECDRRMGFICQTDPVPSADKTLFPELKGLFRRGRCAVAFYEYRNQCFSLSMASATEQRSATVFRDAISAHCMAMSHATPVDCGHKETPWATAMCPVVATPHTHADAAFLRSLLNTFGMEYKKAWIGLKIHLHNKTFNLESEDESVLGASSLITFDSQLLADQPNVDSRYSCLTLSSLDSEIAQTDCSISGYPVACSYYLPGHPLYPSNRLQHVELCPPGFTAFDSRCYWSAPLETQLNWAEAEAFCQALARNVTTTNRTTARFAGHLASIHTFEQQHLISEIAASTSLWIGLSSVVIPGRLASEHQVGPVHLRWSDNSPVDYISLTANEITMTDNFLGCFGLVGNDRHWHQTACYQQRSFVCQLSPPDVYDLSTYINADLEPPVLCDQTFPLLSASRQVCYRIIESEVDWAGAEGFCRNLESGAHLAAVHSNQELTDLITLLQVYVEPHSSVWLGLTESEMAYKWSDGTPVNFVPFSADTSKANRHLSQDCFALQPTNSTENSRRLHAITCSERLRAFVCQRGSSVNKSQVSYPDPTTWKPVLCPPGYRQYADRCFALLPSSLSWSQANHECSESATKFRGYSGSLARIDSVFVQDFVASLLDDLPSKTSSAWIGLQRDISEEMPNMHWSDGVEANFLRSVYRSEVEPAFNAEVIKGLEAVKSTVKLCTAIYRSTHPRLNGLWLQWACDQNLQLPSICQAIPPDGMNVNTENTAKANLSCPVGFALGTTGFSTDPNKRISQPVCYRLLSGTEKLDWNTSSTRCKALSNEKFNVNLLSVASVFEANFLRSWLRLPRSMDGAGLTPDEPVWSGLNVTAQSPGSDGNWTWDTLDREPVRYTDWLTAPAMRSGCYLFHSNPFQIPVSMLDSGLGSLQPAQSCATNYLAVCQATTKSVSGVGSIGSLIQTVSLSHQRIRLPCTDSRSYSKSSQYYAPSVISQSGKPCLRWDLISVNLTTFRLDWNSLGHRLSAADAVGGEGNPSYAENYCSLVDLTTGHQEYGCYVQANPPVFEPCRPTNCMVTVSSRSGGLSPISLFFVLLFTILLITAIAFALWRHYGPRRAGYRRYFNPSSTAKRQAPVHFFMPSKRVDFRLTPESQNKLRVFTRLPETSTSSDGPRSSRDPAQPSDSNVVVCAPDVPVGSMGFVNPFDTSNTIPFPEDDYDPETEI